MTNAAHMQRCVDMPLDETPTKHGSRQQLRVPPACGSRSRRTQSESGVAHGVGDSESVGTCVRTRPGDSKTKKL